MGLERRDGGRGERIPSRQPLQPFSLYLAVMMKCPRRFMA
jgi:hypothetical protein